MFNPFAVIKKMKKDTDLSKDIKSMNEYAMDTMKPKSMEIEIGEDEEEDSKQKPKKKSAESKVEIEMMLEGAKKKKGRS